MCRSNTILWTSDYLLSTKNINRRNIYEIILPKRGGVRARFSPHLRIFRKLKAKCHKPYDSTGSKNESHRFHQLLFIIHCCRRITMQKSKKPRNTGHPPAPVSIFSKTGVKNGIRLTAEAPKIRLQHEYRGPAPFGAGPAVLNTQTELT